MTHVAAPLRIGRAILAGSIALAVNFACLLSADALGIVTARGGFQRLVKLWLGPVLETIGIGSAWRAWALPDPGGAVFMVGFKIVVGLGMALAYAAVVGRLPGRTLVKGLWAAAGIWLLNAGLVLPLLNEGFAGARSLTALGITVFALAHTAFFVVLALVYTRHAHRG